MRPNFLDVSKSIGIWIVIIGHYPYFFDIQFENNLIWNVAHIVTLFHMPLFFYISGLLHKYREFKPEVKNLWERLITPYLLLSLFVFIINYIFEYIYTRNFSINDIASATIGTLSGNTIGYNECAGPLWFVYSLITVKLIIAFSENQLQKYCNIIFLLCVTCGLVIMYTGYRIPLRISSSLIGFIFFILGYKTKKIILIFEQISKTKIIFFALISLAVLFVCAKYNINFNARNGGLSINTLRFGEYPILFFISGMAGVGFVFSISELLLKFGFKNNLMLLVSKANIVILAFHKLIYYLCRGFITDYNITSLLCFSIFNLAVCTLIYYLLSNNIPLITGKR